MDKQEEIDVANIDPLTKEQENENDPLRKMDIIDIASDKIEKNNEIKFKYYLKIFYFVIFLLIIFFLLKYLLRNTDNNYIYTVYNSKGNSVLKENNTSKNETKINVGFIYSSLSGNGIARFMVVTGEYLVRTGKYNVYFFTKEPSSRELSFNEKIKRIYGYNNRTIIKQACKKEKIDFLIINNVFGTQMINWYKSLGVKAIGIFHGVFMSPMFNNSTQSYRSWKNLNLYDAFIHISADDYYYYKNLGFDRNIFIPNLYTFEPSKSPSSNLTNHNIMMLGRLNDKKKGLIYALSAMNLIIKEIPDARLNLVSSDGKSQELINNIKRLNLTNNVFYIPFTPNIADNFLNTSVFFFPSLTEAFPMALNEAKAYGLPCVTFDVSYSIPLQTGVIKVDTFDYKGLARETIKLLKDYNYRVKMGKEAKLSLNRFTNEYTTNLWGRLFKSLKSGEEEFQELRQEIESKYYNEKLAEKHMAKQLEYLKMYNKFFRCHSLKDFTNINYINNIQECKNVKR